MFRVTLSTLNRNDENETFGCEFASDALRKFSHYGEVNFSLSDVERLLAQLREGRPLRVVRRHRQRGMVEISMDKEAV